jgi:O-antigen ligase
MVNERVSADDGEAAIPPAAWAVAVAAAVLPFLADLPIDYDRLAPVALLPALWLGRKFRAADQGNAQARKIDRALLTVAAVVALLSTLLGPHPVPSLVSLASWVWILAGAFLTRRLAVNPRALRVILAGITLGATLGCLVVWAQWVEGTPINAFPHYGHGRLFGLHMMVGTMTALAWVVLTPAQSVARMLGYVVAVINCGGMLWSGGRAPLVGAAAGLVLWYWRSEPAERHILVRGVPLVLLGGTLLSCLRWSPEPYLGWWGALARTSAATSVDALSSTRLSFWQVTWHEILQAPWIGHGADSYRFIVPKQDGNQPHNWVLQFLLDLGVLGAGSLGLLLLRQAHRGLVGNRADGDAEVSVARRAIAGGLVACLAAGLLDGVFYHAVLLLPAALLAAMAGATRGESTGNPGWIRRSGRLRLAISAALLGLHSYVVASMALPPAPAGPDAPAARLLRMYPSTTFGLEGWLNTWRATKPNAVLEWSQWAQRHSDNPAQFHVYAAVLYADQRDFASATREVEAAMLKAHWNSLPKLRILLAATRAAEAQAQARPPKR